MQLQACFALTAFTVVKFLKPDPNRKKILVLADFQCSLLHMKPDGMGFEGYQGYDISDMKTKTPGQMTCKLKHSSIEYSIYRC